MSLSGRAGFAGSAVCAAALVRGDRSLRRDRPAGRRRRGRARLRGELPRAAPVDPRGRAGDLRRARLLRLPARRGRGRTRLRGRRRRGLRGADRTLLSLQHAREARSVLEDEGGEGEALARLAAKLADLEPERREAVDRLLEAIETLLEPPAYDDSL